MNPLPTIRPVDGIDGMRGNGGEDASRSIGRLDMDRRWDAAIADLQALIAEARRIARIGVLKS